MTPLELTGFVTFLANYLSCQITDTTSLALLGTILNQLGDTLATIALQKDICESSCNPPKKES